MFKYIYIEYNTICVYVCVCAHVYVRVHNLRNSDITDTDGSNTGILQLSEVQRQKAC